jgi:predicted PhzF superfamily epimerase YddE/YHI9
MYSRDRPASKPVTRIDQSPCRGWCIAALVRQDGLLRARSYVASEGSGVGRDGRIAIEFEGDTIWLGGHAVTCIEGSLKI